MSHSMLKSCLTHSSVMVQFYILFFISSVVDGDTWSYLLNCHSFMKCVWWTSHFYMQLALNLFWRFMALYFFLSAGSFLEKSSLVLPDFMVLNHSWEAGSHSADQEIVYRLCIPKAHYHIYNILPPASVLSWLNSVHTLTSYFAKIPFNIIIPSSTPVCQQRSNIILPSDLPCHDSGS